MNLKDKKKGFTLIELMVVMAIIAILSAVLIPKIGNMTGEAKNTGVIQNGVAILGTTENVLGKAVLTSVKTLDLTTELDKLQLKNPVTKGGLPYKVLTGLITAETLVPGCIYLQISKGTATDIGGITLHRVQANGTIMPLLVAGN